MFNILHIFPWILKCLIGGKDAKRFVWFNTKIKNLYKYIHECFLKYVLTVKLKFSCFTFFFPHLTLPRKTIRSKVQMESPYEQDILLRRCVQIRFLNQTIATHPTEKKHSLNNFTRMLQRELFCKMKTSSLPLSMLTGYLRSDSYKEGSITICSSQSMDYS